VSDVVIGQSAETNEGRVKAAVSRGEALHNDF